MKLQVIHLPLAQYTAHTGSSKICWPVSAKGVLPAPWFTWITIDRKFVSMASVCYSDPFFLLFLIMLSLRTSLHGLAVLHGQWRCLVMSFFFPINISTVMLKNSSSQTPWLNIGLMATSVCFSSSPVSIGWGSSVYGCWLLGVGSTVGSVQLCSRSFLVSLRIETAWGSPAITGLYF